MEEPLNIERDVVKNGVRLDCVFEGYVAKCETCYMIGSSQIIDQIL